MRASIAVDEDVVLSEVASTRLGGSVTLTLLAKSLVVCNGWQSSAAIFD